MLIVSLLANLAYALVFARGMMFALTTSERRQADNCEVAVMMTASLLYVITFISLWVFEPWKLINNSPTSTMFVGFTILNAAYFFRRLEALTIGRERRKDERRGEDVSADRRMRRTPE